MQAEGCTVPVCGRAMNGESPSLDATFREVYERLKSLARRQISWNRGETLDTTELVHELYERMSCEELAILGGPRSFFAYAAGAMRNILTDRARRRLSQKGGGGWLRVPVPETIEDGDHELAANILALDEALRHLHAGHARAASVVELRYFAGLSVDQIADVMGVTRRTVLRDWNFARAFLHSMLEDR